MIRRWVRPACTLLGLLVGLLAGPVAAQVPATPSLTYVERAIRSDPELPLPLVVVVHGLGDRPERFLPWVLRLRERETRARVIAPQGPATYGEVFSWFPTRLPLSKPGPETVEGIERSADRLARLIEYVAVKRPTTGKAIVVGFSQGGVLAFALAARYPELVQAAIPIAGTLPEPLLPAETLMSKPRIIAFHGGADDVVPLSGAEAATRALRRAGAVVDLRIEKTRRHELPVALQDQVLDTLVELLKQ